MSPSDNGSPAQMALGLEQKAAAPTGPKPPPTSDGRCPLCSAELCVAAARPPADTGRPATYHACPACPYFWRKET